MKKFVSLVLALVLAMSLCAVNMPASAEGTTEIIYWQNGNANQKDEAVAMKQLNEQLQKVYPELSVNIVFIQGSE